MANKPHEVTPKYSFIQYSLAPTPPPPKKENNTKKGARLQNSAEIVLCHSLFERKQS